MKLHLPTALFALAVLPAVAFAEEGATSYSYVVTQDGDTTKTVFTGNGCGINIEESSYNDLLRPANGSEDPAPIPGNIGGLKKGDKTGVNTDILVTGNNTALDGVNGVGPGGYSASGNKTITVTNGASVVEIFGLGYDRRACPDATADTSKQININVTDGGMAGMIMGTAYSISSNTDQNDRITNEKVTITVDGGAVGRYKDANGIIHQGDYAPYSIIAAGYFGTCVNNDVEVNLLGDSDLYGNVVIMYTKSTLDSYVNSATINIDGATVNGSIYAGGHRADGTDTATMEVKNNTAISLIDGKVTGDIYGAANSNNIVGGNTKVTLAGGSVNGNVYGAGTATVKGNTEVVIKGVGTQVGGTIYGSREGGTVNGDKILAFDSATNAAMDYALDKAQNFNAVGFQNMGSVNFDDTKYNRFDTLYVSSKDATSNTTVTTTLSRDGFKKAVVDNKGMLTLTGTNMQAENLVIKDGGTVSFVPSLASQQVVAADFSAAAAEGAPKVITLASKLELGSGSTLLLNSYALDLGANDLTVYAGAEIWTIDSNAAVTLAMTEEVLSGFITTTGNVAFYNAEGKKVESLAATVNGQTGTLGYSNGAVTFTSAGGGSTPAVPEPATATLSLLALAGLCARRRRK